MIWLLFIIMAILMWSATGLLYKAGVHDGKEEHICLKYSVCIGMVFFVIALVCLIIRDESFTIFESAVRFWPMTVFGIVYAIVNTISLKGYVYNEATVQSPVEGISGGVSTDPLLAVYPVFVMIGGRIFMKEKVGKAQYFFLLGIVAGSVLVVADTIS